MTGKNPPLTGRFFVKPLGKALGRVGAGAVWMRGGGLYGRPLLEEARPVTSPPHRRPTTGPTRSPAECILPTNIPTPERKNPLGHGFVEAGAHHYTQHGKLTVTLNFTDMGGSSITASQIITV